MRRGDFEACTHEPGDYNPDTRVQPYYVFGWRYGSRTMLGSTDSFATAERLRQFWSVQELPE
jgi:hypothetical protein